MKRLTAAFMLLAGLVVFSGKAWAVADTLELRVTPLGTRIAQITAGADFYDFTSVDLAGSTISASATSVSNIGTLVAKFQLQITGADPVWTDNDTTTGPAADQYVLQALFNAGQPAAGAVARNDDVRSGAANVATGLGGVYSGDQNASAVLAGQSRNLWFRLRMPTTSSEFTQRVFTVTIDAVP